MSSQDQDVHADPLDTPKPLEPQPSDSVVRNAHSASIPSEEDSAVTKADKFERRKLDNGQHDEEPASKRVKIEDEHDDEPPVPIERHKGVAPIKAEYLVHTRGSRRDRESATINDDAAEASPHLDPRDQPDSRNGAKKEKNKGQNKGRSFGHSRDERGLCQSRAMYPEFSPSKCPYGDTCRYEHDLRKYLKEWKRQDLKTLGGQCPIWTLKGKCDAGWKCRFAGSHAEEKELADGRKELVLIEGECIGKFKTEQGDEAAETRVVNIVSTGTRADLMKRKIQTPKADVYTSWLDKSGKEAYQRDHQPNNEAQAGNEITDDNHGESAKDLRARYREPPLLPSEKRRIYFGPETPVLAPLTTQGNLPFRRLCVGLGAQVTYSEMAMSMPLVQGLRSEWALMKAHESETRPPRYYGNSIRTDYDNSKDFKFGAQIAGNKPYQVLKATEILCQLCPRLRVIDLNCGCPIDLVYRQGAGSALLDNQSKLEKMLRGMNAVSAEIPITVKIRMGTKDGKPSALKLVNRLVYGSREATESPSDPAGIAAITLHGRSRQQRYTRNADWQYISECAALIKSHTSYGDSLADTVREADARHLPAANRAFFIGNGDCYSHTDYTSHLADSGVDSVMIARGALIKPWVFEEIEKGQYLDKSATERLALVEQFVRYGLETWGSDEMGVGTTRRFLLEWLSFAYRYVPVGILEYLPPSLQDRPPAWKGRNELETLLGSGNYKDWIKISEMFLGPAHKDFRFEPKHKSNSYEIEAEG